MNVRISCRRLTCTPGCRSEAVRRALLGAGVRLPRAGARVHAAQAPRPRAPLQRAAAALAR